MEASNLLPIYLIGYEIKDGYLIKMNDFCRKNCNSKKCEDHYKKIFASDVGIYECPHGFTTYAFQYGPNKEIFTSFKLKDHFNKKKVKGKFQENIFSPVLTEQQLNDIVVEYLRSYKIALEHNEAVSFIKDGLHEIRGLNGQVLTYSEELVERMNNLSNKKQDKESLEMARSISATSFIIASRFSAYDATVNPESLKLGSKYSTSIYGKFHMCKKCLLGETKRKELRINIRGESTKKINTYQTFDLIPFLLLDNAIKYSPNGQDIDIRFSEKSDELIITIESCGPFLSESEIEMIFTKNYRAPSAIETGVQGSGIGLFLAQQICELHKIAIKISFQKSDYIDKKVTYGCFKVELKLSATP